MLSVEFIVTARKVIQRKYINKAEKDDRKKRDRGSFFSHEIRKAKLLASLATKA